MNTKRLVTLVILCLFAAALVVNAAALSALLASGDGVSDECGVSPDVPAVSAGEPAEEAVRPQELSFELPGRYLNVGGTFTPSLSFSPDDAEPSLIGWRSSDESVATVDADGVVTAVAPGAVYLTAFCGELEYSLWLDVVSCGTIYLSPSSDEWQKFSCGGTNEAEQMLLVANSCSERLGTYGVECVVAEAEDNALKRSKNAEALGAAFYIGLQATVRDDQLGTCAYYHDSSGEGLGLAQRLYANIGAMTPSKDRTGIVNGAYYKLAEVVNCWENGRTPCVVLGVEDRYSREGTQWIVDNSQLLGCAIADSIMEYCAGY